MLSDEEQAAFGVILRDREKEILDRLVANEDSAEPPSLDEEIGRLTRMDHLQQQQMALHARRRLKTQLAQVRGALGRVEKGAFGACAMCSGDLPRRRLDLAPEAPFCVTCQEKLEREGRR